MKKLLKSLLCLLLIISSLVNCSVISFSIEASTKTAQEFLEELEDIINNEEYLNVTASVNSFSCRIIVKTNDNTKINDSDAVDKVEGYNGYHIFQYDSVRQTESAMNYYENLSNVEFVELDETKIIDLEEDLSEEAPIFDIPPSINDVGSQIVGSQAAVSYIENLHNVSTVKVAVLDTGIDYSHSFFASDRLLDSETNLYNVNSTSQDDHGHGTHVAGIIYNNTPENVKIIGYKVLNKNGELTYINKSKTALTIEKAVDDHVDVINMSLSVIFKNFETSKVFENAIEYAFDKKVPVVAASGNDGRSLNGTSQLASLDKAIIVGSVSSTLSPSNYTNYGTCVDICAPGENINSTLLYENQLPSNIIGTNGETYSYNHHHYATLSGTSMATPFVASAIAVLKTVDKSYTVNDIEFILKNSSNRPNNWNDSNYGAGILDMTSMLNIKRTKSPKITLTTSGAVISPPTNTNGTTIYYTTDNTIPTESSNVYSGIIPTNNLSVIRAIAVEDGQMPSSIVICVLAWKEDIAIRYKGIKHIKYPKNFDVKYIDISDSSVAILSEDGLLQGLSIGESIIVVKSNHNQRITYNVTVKYAWWQQLIRYLLLGFLWY